MVAVLDYRTESTWSSNGPTEPALAGRHPHLQLVEDGDLVEAPVRPAVKAEGLVDVLLSRRVLAILGGLVVGYLALMVMQPGPPAGFDPTFTSPSAVEPAGTGETILVASAGDTYWGIASDLVDGEDIRPFVNALVERNGGDFIVVGQEVIIPAFAG